MRAKRLILAAVVALGLSPGLFVRSGTVDPELFAGEPVSVRALDLPALTQGPLTMVGAWQLDTRDARFGGYSALVANGPGALLAASDTGRLLAIRVEQGAPVAAQILNLPRRGQGQGRVSKEQRDIESLTRDPETGVMWAGYEARNAIERISPDLRPERRVRPLAMRDWGANSGPEALARLPGGRFIALEERPLGDGQPGHDGLLFGTDPTRDQASTPFIFIGLDGYRPVDMVARANGRLIVLMRRFSLALPPRFDSAIMVLDPERIAAGATVEGRLLTKFGAPFPFENYEGVALTREAGATYLWLISDDNFMSYQRSLLLKLRLDPRQKARE